MSSFRPSLITRLSDEALTGRLSGPFTPLVPEEQALVPASPLDQVQSPPAASSALEVRPGTSLKAPTNPTVLMPSGYTALTQGVGRAAASVGNVEAALFRTDKVTAPIFWALLSGAFTGGRGNYLGLRKALLQRRDDSFNPTELLQQIMFTPAVQYNRPALMGMVTGLMELSTNRLKVRLEEQPVDFVVIGGGPHGAAAFTVAARINTQRQQAGKQPLSGILAEGALAPLGSSNFGPAGDNFDINSRVRKKQGGNPLLALGTGQDDINPTGGPVTVPTMTGRAYPKGSTLSDAASINTFLATQQSTSLRPLYGQQVLKVLERPGSTTRYELPVADAETGEVRLALTNKVLILSGLGEPNVPFPEGTPSFKFCTREFSANTKILRGLPPEEAGEALRKREPRLMSAEQYLSMVSIVKDGRAQFRRATLPQINTNSDAYRAFLRLAQGQVGQQRAGRVNIQDTLATENLLIASGDGSKVVAFHWAGLADAASYDNVNSTDVAQQGDLGKTAWITGNNGPANCQELKRTFRGRYLTLAAFVERAPEFRSDPSPVNTTQWKLADSNAVCIGPYGDDAVGVLYPNDVGGQTLVVARNVVTGFGYKTNNAPLLSDLIGIDRKVPLETSAFVSDVNGVVDGSLRVVGLRVNKHEIYVGGPAAGPKKLAPGNPAGVGENSAGVAGLLPGTQVLAQKVLGQQVARFSMRDDTPAPLRLETSGGRAITDVLGGAPSTRNAPDEAPKIIVGLLGNALRGADASGDDVDEIKVTLHTDGNDLLVDTLGFEGPGRDAFTDRLREDKALQRQARTLLKVKGDAIAVTYGLLQDGTVDTANLEVTLGQRTQRRRG
jgi:hypothetical protein